MVIVDMDFDFMSFIQHYYLCGNRKDIVIIFFMC